MVFCDSALLSHLTTFEFHGGEPGHALHNGRYQILRGSWHCEQRQRSCRTQQPECDPMLFPVVVTILFRREGQTCQDLVPPPLLALVDRLQEVSEDPLGDLPALLPGLFIREAEMDAVVDADIDRILGQLREAMIRTRLWVR
jgi:hypothetical protein